MDTGDSLKAFEATQGRDERGRFAALEIRNRIRYAFFVEIGAGAGNRKGGYVRRAVMKAMRSPELERDIRNGARQWRRDSEGARAARVLREQRSLPPSRGQRPFGRF